MWLHFKRPGVVAAALLCLLALQAFNHARPVETLTDIPDIWTDRYAYHDKVPILKECHFGRVKLWDIEHFWTLFGLHFWA